MIQNRRNYISPGYRVGRWGRTWIRPGHVVRIKEGTLGIDIVDRRQQELVWQGVVKGILDREQPANNLIQAVEEVLAKFSLVE